MQGTRYALMLLLTAALRAGAQTPDNGIDGKIEAINGHLVRSAKGLEELPSAQSLAERSRFLQDLIGRDPSRALKLALDEDTLAALRRAAPQHAALLETWGEWSGSVTQVVEDDFEHQQSRTLWWLRSDGVELNFRSVAGEPESLSTGVTAIAKGLRAGTMVAATRISPVPKAAGTATSYCQTTGEQRTAVLLTTFPGVDPPAYDKQAFRDLFFGTAGKSVSEYWREVSYGKTWATGEVFGTFELDRSYGCDNSDLFKMRDAALAAAAAQQIDLTAYSRIFIYFPGSCSGWSAKGSVGCNPQSVSWMPMGTAAGKGPLAAHEGGHNLGLQHGYSRQYPSEALGAPYDTGTRTEYNDYFSNMGWSRWVHYTARQKLQLGWLSPEEVVTVNEPGTYPLLPLSSPIRGPKALRVHRPGTENDWFWIESRLNMVGAYESDLPASYSASAVIHYEDRLIHDSEGARPVDLLDMTPGGPRSGNADFLDAALDIGASWTDTWTGLTIQPGQNDFDGFVISIRKDPGCAAFSEEWRRQNAQDGAGTIQVIAPADCSWSVSASQPWADSISPASGRGNATVAYHVTANDNHKVRRAALSVDRALFSIVQDGYGITAVETIPARGKGYAQTFTFVYNVPANTSMPFVQATFSLGTRFCSVQAYPAENAIMLRSETGYSEWAPAGTKGTLQTPSCSLDLASSSMEYIGEQLYVRAALRFQTTLVGKATSELFTWDAGTETWAKYLIGNWTVGADADAKPAIADKGVVNAASLISGAVAPGEAVAISGAGMGQKEAASTVFDSSGRLWMNAGGTSVFFDDVQAPLIMASDTLVRAIVPYGVSDSTRLRVEYRGNASDEVTLPVTVAAPAIFTWSATGPAIAINEDGSINAHSRPAARGGMISFYATGEGRTVSSWPDGKLAAAPDWPVPAGQMSVKFGDVPGEVAIARVASPGVLQVFARIPAGAQAGADIPLVLSVGGAASPAVAVSLK